MYNWSTNTARLVQNDQEFERYKLEQQINFGLNGEKLSLRALKKHWNQLVIDKNRRRFLHKLIWLKS